MPHNNSTELIERLTWEGVVDAQTAIAFWIGLAVVAGWALWRERKVIGGGWALAFWLARCTAFACALWMLAGPTRQEIHRTKTDQTIAIFADCSESMTVVDAQDVASSLRISLATGKDAASSPLTICDRIGVSLGVALSDCGRLGIGLKERRSTARLAAELESIHAAVSRAATHTDRLQETLDVDFGLSSRAAQLGTALRRLLAESLGPVRESMTATTHAATDLTSVQEEIVEGLTAARRRSLVLATDLAERLGTEGAAAAADQELTRREQAARLLDNLEQSLSDRSDELHIERYAFDHMTTPVSAEEGWSTALSARADTAQLPVFEATQEHVDDDGQPTPADGGTTNLSSVLGHLATQRANQPVRMAIIFSDGRHNDPAAAAPQELAAQLVDSPVYVVPIGNSDLHRDVLLHRVEAPAAIAQKDSAVIDVIVSAAECDGQTTAAVLRQDGREIDRQAVTLEGSRGDSRVRFMVPAKEPGWQEMVVEVEPVEGEENTANNFQPVSFEVVRDKLRLLLSDGVARWEYRYLNQLFRRDEHAECDELVFFPHVHGTGALADRPEFPSEVEGWARYDVVILGDVSAQQLPAVAQSSLVEYIRARGGKLIVVAGQNSMPGAFVGQPLMEILPVERATNFFPQQGQQLRLTQEGRLNTALMIEDSAADSLGAWESIYERFPVFGLSEFSRPKASARTLIEAFGNLGGGVTFTDDQVQNAFLCWQRVGAGRVAFVAAPDTYRLRWRRGDRMHHRFWGQFLRWMTAADVGAGDDTLRLQTDRARYNVGEPVEVTVWLKDSSGRALAGEALSAKARAFNDERSTINLTGDADVAGRYFGTFGGLGAGAYRIGVNGQAIDKSGAAGKDADGSLATITVSSVESVEMANTQCNRVLLGQVAELTGGQVIPPTAISEVLELASFTPEVTEHIERTPLWNRWTMLVAVLGCLFTEWIVRKSKGLV